MNLGNLPNMVGVELRIAQIMADRAFKAIRSPEMPSGHYTVLALIGLNPGCSQSALAQSMHLDRSSMVPILDSFQRKGWIERRAVDGDRRTHALHLTEAGNDVLARVEAKVKALEDLISARMGEDNKVRFLELLTLFQSIIDQPELENHSHDS